MSFLLSLGGAAVLDRPPASCFAHFFFCVGGRLASWAVGAVGRVAGGRVVGRAVSPRGGRRSFPLPCFSAAWRPSLPRLSLSLSLSLFFSSLSLSLLLFSLFFSSLSLSLFFSSFSLSRLPLSLSLSCPCLCSVLPLVCVMSALAWPAGFSWTI